MYSAYLITERLQVDVVHPLEMRVKRVDNGERHLQQMLNDEAERDVIGKSYFITNGNYFAITCSRYHLNSESTTYTESSTASCKPLLELEKNHIMKAEQREERELKPD